MIALKSFAGKSVVVFGLGGSGLATAQALIAGGANVLAFDDNEARNQAARQEGIACADLRTIDFAAYEALVLAPGVPLTHPKPHWSVIKAQAAGIEVIGDVELFNRERLARQADCPFIAITGTNGKSTTTALIAHILQSAGRDVQMGGNIGRAVLTLEPFEAGRCYVVECSSYQIDLAPSLRPSIGIHLNLTPDHIDRHGSFEHYAAVKARLIYGAAFSVVGIDDALSRGIAEQAAGAGGRGVRISVQGLADIHAREGGLFANGQKVADLAALSSLRGVHNAQNAAAAYAACRELGLSDEAIQQGFASFPGLAHRMEQVAEMRGIVIINDSKATNADATARALASFERIYWILGGQAKEGGIASLKNFFPKILHAFLIGEASGDFAGTLEGEVVFSECETLEKATRAALHMAFSEDKIAKENTAILLSPACASFDQFSNFEARGDCFRQLVRDCLKKIESLSDDQS